MRVVFVTAALFMACVSPSPVVNEQAEVLGNHRSASQPSYEIVSVERVFESPGALSFFDFPKSSSVAQPSYFMVERKVSSEVVGPDEVRTQITQERFAELSRETVIQIDLCGGGYTTICYLQRFGE